LDALWAGETIQEMTREVTRMEPGNVLLLLVTVFVFVYLTYVLFYPTRF
jgi:hypothetical protein